MFYIGCHLSKKKGMLIMAEAAASIGAKAIQFFTRNPRGGHEKAIDPRDLQRFNVFTKEHGIKYLLAYAPYTLEPASADTKQHDFAAMVMAEDLAQLEVIPGQSYLLRPGSALDITAEEAMKNLAATLNETITPTQSTTVLLYTMPGSGTQICSQFEELAQVIEQVNLKDKVGVCLDASAVWAAGYDIVNDLDGVLDQFDKAIGLDKLLAVHLNDCKEACGAHADRHARIGEGAIGFEALSALTNHPALKEKPFYLEEPLDTLSVYSEDILRFTEAYQG